MTFDEYWESAWTTFASQPEILSTAFKEVAFKAWVKADRNARMECADICDRVWSGPHAEYKDGAQVCEEFIRGTIKW
jgi:hypothetical protein